MAEIKLDPNFMLPEGIVGVGYDLPNENADPQVDDPNPASETVDIEEGDDGGEFGDSGEAGDNEMGLETPTNITIVGQYIRTAKDGASTVDIIIECDSVEGADDYEVRLAR